MLIYPIWGKIIFDQSINFDSIEDDLLKDPWVSKYFKLPGRR